MKRTAAKNSFRQRMIEARKRRLATKERLKRLPVTLAEASVRMR
jgi:hypothetical protein